MLFPVADKNAGRRVGGTAAVIQGWGTLCSLASQPLHINPVTPSCTSPSRGHPTVRYENEAEKKDKGCQFHNGWYPCYHHHQQQWRSLNASLSLPPNLQRKESNLIFFSSFILFYFADGNSVRRAIYQPWYIALRADCWQLMALLSGFAYLAV